MIIFSQMTRLVSHLHDHLTIHIFETPASRPSRRAFLRNWTQRNPELPFNGKQTQIWTQTWDELCPRCSEDFDDINLAKHGTPAVVSHLLVTTNVEKLTPDPRASCRLDKTAIPTQECNMERLTARNGRPTATVPSERDQWLGY